MTERVPAEQRTMPEGIVAAIWQHKDKCKPWDKNPRDNRENVPHVAMLIQIYGFVAPVCVWTSHDFMVAGHTRIKAIELLLSKPEERERDGFIKSGPLFVPRGAPPGVEPGMVPVRYHEFRSAAEAKAYAIADNRSNELSKWDEKRLREVIPEIRLEAPQLVDSGALSFTSSQIQQIDAGTLVPELDKGRAGKGDGAGAGGNAAEKRLPHFRIGQYRLYMTEQDYVTLEEKLSEYQERHGSLNGFARKMIEGFNAKG